MPACDQVIAKGRPVEKTTRLLEPGWVISDQPRNASEHNQQIFTMPHNLPAIYLVTPCYNAAATLGRTLESIIGQQKIVLRYHVQDAASTDGSQDVLASFAARIAADPARYGHIEFTWSSERDAGLYDGISRAFGCMDIPSDALMGWLNADDTLCDGALAQVGAAATDLPQCDWFCGVPRVIGETGELLAQGRADYVYPQQLIAAGTCDGLHWRNLQQEGSFWRKRLWDKAGGIDTRFHLAGDWDLWRRMAQHSACLQLPCTLAAFHKRDGQLSAGNAYLDELDSFMPRSVRRKALLRFLAVLKKVPVNTVQQVNGHWIVSPTVISLGWKDWLGMLLTGAGCYKLFQLCCQLNTCIKRCMRERSAGVSEL